MALTPGERDRLLLFTQAQLAQQRKERGLKLNIPEATAIISDAVCEWAREGKTLPEVRQLATTLLTIDDVLPEVPDIVTQIMVEARFDDGTRLVVVQQPFGWRLPAWATLSPLPQPPPRKWRSPTCRLPPSASRRIFTWQRSIPG